MRRFFGRPQGGDPYGYDRGPISGNDAADPYRAEDHISIKHGHNEYLFKYPVGTIASRSLTVGHVKDKCREITGVDYNRLSLICAGRTLKDDHAMLKDLGVEHGAKILCMGTNAAPPSAPKTKGSNASLRSLKQPQPSPQASPQPEAKKPVTAAEIIEAVRAEVEMKLLPLIEEFLANPPEDPDKRKDQHRRLSETVMGELLKLDSVESSEPDIRARRKEVVREIQGTLERLDTVLPA